jgi:copper(I)-binding protein
MEKQRMRMILAAAAAALAVGSTVGAQQEDAVSEPAGGALLVENVWAQPTLAGSQQGAVYLTVRNDGDGDDALVSVSTPVAEHAMLHASVVTNGTAVMTAQENVPAPAHDSVVFEPGGLHVMLMGVAEPLTVGMTAPITFTFAHAGAVETTFTVRTLQDYLSEHGSAAGMAHGEGEAMGDHSAHD